MFSEISALHYNQWMGTLQVGGEDMSCPVQVCPPPKPFCRTDDFQVLKRELSNTLVVKGFFSQADISSPPVYSRHLVLPAPANTNKENREDEAKVPNTCVFLHG